MVELTPEWAFDDGDRTHMRAALEEARAAAGWGDVPVGAVVVGPEGTVIARSGNRREADVDPTGHAEVSALRRAAAALGRWRLDDCRLYVTLEPCAMCAAACVEARVGLVVWGAPDPKRGFAGSLGNLLEDPRMLTRVAWRGGLLAEQCGAVLEGFFAKLREGG